MPRRTEAKIRRELAELNEEAAALQAQLEDIKARKSLVCQECGRRTPVKLLTYIQTHWYTSPYGCTGGDYWNRGEGRYECPKCGHENREYYDENIPKLKQYFKEVVKTYGQSNR